jgi:ribosomal-protein-alanine N-acetyltransferase
MRRLSPRFRHIEVRRVTAADLVAIQSLATQAWQVHLHVPLEELTDWVQPVSGVRPDAPFFAALSRGRLCGFLLAIERQPGISLIGAAALDDGWSVESFLDFLLPPLVEVLNSRGVSALVHMGHAPWLTETLQKCGFRLYELVITLEKRDRYLPSDWKWGGDIRGARRQDLPALVALDEVAFIPLWRNNSYTLANALVHATSFTVAETGNVVAGYQFSHLDGRRGHVSRLVVHPKFQGQGIGSALLAAAIQALWDREATVISLNTQQHNEVSQRLYSRFGFQPTGESVPVLWLSLRPVPGDPSRA